MAAHYGVAILPTRIVKPRDKAKVEVGVQIVERWILARLRNMTFFSLGELKPRHCRVVAPAQRAAVQKATRLAP